MFLLQFGQNGLKHSRFFLVTHTLHTGKFHTFSQTVLPPSLFVLCFSKHERLLKLLLQNSHGTRSSEYIHGGTDLQSQHVSPHLCVVPRSHPLLQPLHTYCRAIAPVRLLITWKCLCTASYIRFILFSDSTWLSKYMSLQSNPPKTTILYSLKYSWNRISSGTPPASDISIPVVSSKLLTT